MTVLLFLFGVFLAMGLFFLASSFLRLPTLRTARAMLGTVRQEKKTVKTIEAIWKHTGEGGWTGY